MINWAKKPPIKKEKKEIRRAREKDRNKFAKKKKLREFNYVRLARKYGFFLAKLVFRHSYAN